MKSSTESTGMDISGKVAEGRPPTISARGQGRKGGVQDGMYAWWPVMSIWEMVGWVPGGGTFEEIVQKEELFQSHSLAMDTSTQCPGGALGDVDTTMVRATKITQLEKELKKLKKDNEPSAGRLRGYKVPLKNNERTLQREHEL